MVGTIKKVTNAAKEILFWGWVTGAFAFTVLAAIKGMNA